MTLIALVRHGETNYNKNLIIQGQLDIPLNELGRKQAITTANLFQNLKFDLIISSPLSRARETAQIIADKLNYKDEIITNGAFIERNFGVADGKNVKEYIHFVHEDNLEGLEKEETIKQRVYNGLIEVCVKNPDKNIIIVCHSHTIKAAVSVIEPEHYNFKIPLTNCSITLLEYDNNNLKINKVNYNDVI
ncbi:MAG: Phosphoglycerate mutase [Haloplasmataceae bacterium]|jgi:broad specificity phosphatase PhoE|nr:Phosphoglycerate mutase [Haloplasmataceae bacterium]